MTPKQLEDIIRFLDNEMTPSEKIAFEQLILNDEALAKEVTFQRGLHGFLGRNNPALHDKLDALGEEFIIKPQQKQTSKIWINVFIALLIIGLIGYIVWSSTQRTPKIEPEIPNTIQQKEIPTQSEQDSIDTVEETPPSITPTLPKKKIKTLPQPTKTTDDRPIAVLDPTVYQPNDILEGVIKENYRNEPNTVEMTISKPKQDAILKDNPDVIFQVKGTASVSPPYRLIIYNNRTFNIENDYRILNTIVEGKEKEGAYLLNFNAALTLDKGLYYLVIRKENSRDILHISRFKVE